MSMTETAAQQAHQAAEHAAEAVEHAEQGFDAGSTIIHHVLDHKIESIGIPFTDVAIPLPHMEVGGVDLSITKHVVMMWLAFGVLFLLFRLAVRSAKDPVPRGLRNALEVLVVFIRDEVARRAIPTHAEQYTPFLLSTFFFIAACNLLGLVPFMATATGNISVTAGLAFIAFVVIQLGGIREFGLVKHIGNLMPPGLPLWLMPLIFLIEVLSQFIRPFALCIRLFANMMAGHVVILAFISLIFIMATLFSPVAGWGVAPISVAFTLFVYFLELLVAFLQAFIFTMLTAQFIGMSVHPEH